MMAIDDSDAWKQIPPEEKIELLSKAHATGIVAAVIEVIIACTLAVAMHQVALMWGGILLSPFVFQFASGKAWRDFKPRTMLEYLAARSASRRFAFANHAKDLGVNLLFRGHVEEIYGREDVQEALEATIANTKEAEVWIALFNDAIVLMKEEPGGARLQFAHLLNDKLEITSKSNDDKKEYNNSKEVYLSSKEKVKNKRSYKITSPYPAALIVFEKRILQLQALLKKQQETAATLADEIVEEKPTGQNLFG